ncbi:transporter substrate-binding domain-containing protein [Candidatus Liberibacter americanus]|uniref:ABC-type amino acid transport system, periplasmic component n=1 Tax=Candidatus Liberibacter americanus str. Sao Paulo TaxID=1261131 RepID=U6B5R4_9HYPH|nr:transporter substrate-binding domain-containing protein [Candidatus Liberibacter americanus]AHA28183.1 ABC-type amino acid transport system, periplasmic component [Candidatus Liberibacter americanus str. Sao Paulo]EMS36300.1 amino acid-binding periplasmic ABC transporter protein [Candidatus Liberibacter americanus PW_SP]
MYYFCCRLKQLFLSKYKYVVLTISFVTFIAFLFIYSNNESFNTNQKHILRIGTDGTYPPHSFHTDNGKGELMGFDIDLIREVAKRLNLEAKFFETRTDSLIFGIDTNRYDVLVNVAITEERKKIYNFSIPYLSNNLLLIVRNDEKNINSFNDIKGKKVAQILGTSLLKLAEKLKADLIYSDNFEQSLQLLFNKRTDATMVPENPFIYFTKNHRSKSNQFKIADSINEKWSIGFMISKKNDKLKKNIDKTLCEIISDGTYKKIFNRYFEKNDSPNIVNCTS